MLVFLLALLFASPALSACQQPRPIPLGTDRQAYGNISEGSRFNIPIGGPRATARSTLEGQGFSFAGTVDCGDSSLQGELGCRSGQVFDVYDKHHGMGHRTISLEVRNERIVRIAWSFLAVQIDF